MATTPEEFFIKGLLQQSPPSPPIFSNLSQKPIGSSEIPHHIPNDMVLPYISRVLMEDDDMDDNLTDHPALLQVQEPFVQILSSPSFGANAGSTEQGNEFLQDGDGDEKTLDLASSKGADAIRQAFMKGMEEANMLLPKDKSFIRRDELVNQMVVNERTGISVAGIKEPEDNCANKMLDEMMLHGYETCIRNVDKLRIAMDTINAVEKKNARSRNKAATGHALGTHALLLSCAQEVAANNLIEACQLLKQIMQHASATGDATQRLAHCFAIGLEARLAGHHSQLVMAERPSFVEFLEAYNLYFAACCFHKVALSFSTMTIMHAMVDKNRLHIVDYGMQFFGLQWSDLLHLLANREGGLPDVRITAIGLPKTTSFPAEQIEDKVGCRLRKCAHEFGLPSFKFHAIMARNWEDASIKDLHMDADELLIVNDLFSFSTLMEESIFFDRMCPRDSVLGNIKKIRPDVFIQSVINCSYGSSFLSRFRETLYYYTTLFDILDITVPRESRSRLVLEQLVLGRSTLNAIACEGMDLVERPEKYKQWQARNQRAGLRQLPLNPRIVEVVSDKVKKCHHKDFFISQDCQWLLQGWKGRVLFAHSTWVAEDVFSG